MEKRRPAPPPRKAAPKKALPKTTLTTAPAVATVSPKKATPPKKAAPPQVTVPKKATPPQVTVPKKVEPPQVAAPPMGTAKQAPPAEQISYNQLRDMPDADRIHLWTQLNKRAGNNFIPLIKPTQLPKQFVMRLLEAKTRGILRGSKPREKKVHYCPYCTDYMQFRASNYTGYDRCIGCGISTRDYYVSADNRLFDA